MESGYEKNRQEKNSFIGMEKMIQLIAEKHFQIKTQYRPNSSNIERLGRIHPFVLTNIVCVMIRFFYQNAAFTIDSK